MSCQYPELAASTAYRYGCRCGHCQAVKAARGRPGRPAVLPVRVVTVRAAVSYTRPPPPWARRWAKRVWAAWSPAERAEVAAALESVLGELRGAGDGSPAPHRRRRAA